MSTTYRIRSTAAALAVLFGLACQEGGTSILEAGVRASAPIVQVDRFGLPAVATVFIPTAQKDAYNQAAPVNDVAEYTDEVVAVLTSFGHPNPAGLAGALLPDIQPIDLSAPTAFLNGRALADDVITAELGLIFGSNADLNDDHVDANDRPFLGTFPYLAAPHLP